MCFCKIKAQCCKVVGEKPRLGGNVVFDHGQDIVFLGKDPHKDPVVFLRLFHHEGLIEILLVFEKLVERTDGKLGSFRNLVHGDVVKSLLRKKLERDGKHLATMPEFLSFPT